GVIDGQLDALAGEVDEAAADAQVQVAAERDAAVEREARQGLLEAEVALAQQVVAQEPRAGGELRRQPGDEIDAGGPQPILHPARPRAVRAVLLHRLPDRTDQVLDRFHSSSLRAGRAGVPTGGGPTDPSRTAPQRDTATAPESSRAAPFSVRLARQPRRCPM